MIYEIPKGSWVRIQLISTYEVEADSIDEALEAAGRLVADKGEFTDGQMKVQEKSL